MVGKAILGLGDRTTSNVAKVNRSLKNADATSTHKNEHAQGPMGDVILDQYRENIEERTKGLMWDKFHKDRQRARDKKLRLQEGTEEFEANHETIFQQLSSFLSSNGIEEHRVFFESLLHLVVDMFLATSHQQRFSAVVHFVRHLVPDSSTRCIEFARKHFDAVALQGDGDYFGETMVNSLHDLFTMKGNFETTRTWSSIRLIASFVLTRLLNVSDIDDDSMGSLLKEVFKPVKFTGTLVFQLFESMVFLLRQGYQYLHTRKWTHIFYEQDSVSKWIEKWEDAKLMHTNMNSPDPALMKTPQTVLSVLQALVAEGKEIVLYLDKRQRAFFHIPFRQCVELANSVNNAVVGTKFRKAPLCLLVNGDPSVGKSSFLDVICDVTAKFLGFENSEDTRYTRVFTDPFYSGFKTSHQIVILDDLAFEHPNKLSSMQDSSLRDIIQINNNNVFTVNMADLADKGKVYCAPKLVIGTTNCKHLNAKTFYETPYAALRRFPFVISITPRDEVRDVNGGLCVVADDVTFQPIIDELEGDWWHITVEAPVAQKQNGSLTKDTLYKHVMETTSLAEFRKWLVGAVSEHNRTQDMIMASVESRRNIEYCFDCGNEKARCSCPDNQVEIQADEEFATHQPRRPRASECFSRLNQAHFRFGIPLLDWVDKLLCESPELTWICQNFLLMFVQFLFGTFLERWPLILVPRNVLWPMYIFFHVWSTWSARYYLFYWIYTCLPSRVREKIWRFWARRSAPRWLLSQWGVYALAQGLAMLAGLFSAYKVYQWIESAKTNDVQGTSESNEQSVQGSTSSKMTDVYYNDVEKSVAIDFGAKVASWRALPEDEVISKVSNNVISLRGYLHTQEGPRVKKGTAVFLKGQVLVSNLHLFMGCNQFEISHPRMNAPLRCKVASSDIVIRPELDLIFIRFRCVSPFASLIDLIPHEVVADIKCGVTILSRDRDATLVQHKSKKCIFGVPEWIEHETFGSRKFYHYKVSNVATRNGDCGSPYLAHTPLGPCIIALHQTLGTDGTAGGVPLTQRILDEILPSFEVQVQGGSIKREYCDFEVKDWDANSNLRRIEHAHFYCFGSTNRRFPAKSRVRASLLYDHCVEEGMDDNYSKPQMSKRNVWIKQAEPMVARCIRTDHELLDAATEMYISETVDSLVDEDFEVVRVLSDLEALNGVPGLLYVDKLPRKTSAGFPYNCSKSKYLTIESDGTATLHEDFAQDMHQIEALLSNGERSMPVFMATLKDEVVTKEKFQTDKTRVFTGSPMSFSLVMRKYLLTVNSLIQSNRLLFECCVGMDALGPDWHEVALYLKEWSPLYVAGDYKAYDKKMTPDLILAAGRVLLAICHRAGYSNEQISVVRTLMYDIAFPVTNFDGDIVMTCGAEPSGHPLTVIVNSIVGSLLMRMAYIKLGAGGSFKEDVRLLVYGDDNLLSTKNQSFSHTFISDFLASQGLEYTMADKSSDSRPFVSFDECTFLKRRFVWNEELEKFVGPLENASLEKMLMYHIPSGAISEENWAVDVLNTRCREKFFHGKDAYLEALEWSLRVVEELDLESCVEKSHFLPYDQVKFWYLSKFDEIQHIHVEEMGEDVPTPGIVLQCSFDVDDDMFCHVCGNLDCRFQEAGRIVCKRCGRCRPPHPCQFDRWFLGCPYCEDEYPLNCDNCKSQKLHAQVYEGDGLTTHFYCKKCFLMYFQRSSYTVLKKRSNGSYTREPVRPSSRRTRLSVRTEELAPPIDSEREFEL